MRTLCRLLLGAAISALSTAAFADESLWAGEHGLTLNQIANAVEGAAKVYGPNGDGFYRVVVLPQHSLSQVQNLLRRDNIEFILPGSADGVDVRQIDSVREHIAYRQASFRIKTGRAQRNLEPTGAERYQSLEFYLAPRVSPGTGRIDHDAMIEAAFHRSQMPGATAATLDPGLDHIALAPAAWAYVGPYRQQPPDQQFFGTPTLSGRKNGVAQVVSNANIVYVASASGGVWKSVDNGISYSPLSDKWPFLNTTCVVCDPNDAGTVYVGTGDYYGTGAQQSFGIMKTTDGGLNWTNYGKADFGDSVVTRIKVSAIDHNNLVALTAGPTGDIWRSTNAGVTWSRTNAGNGDWQDIDATADGTLWVACGATTGVAVSADQGATWSTTPSPPGSGGTLWDIAVSKNTLARWYIACSNRKIFTTTTSGTVWNDVTAAHDAACSNPDYNWTGASTGLSVTATTLPGNNDLVQVGLLTVTATETVGANWKDVAHCLDPTAIVHMGFHAIVPQTVGTTNFILCSDGGLYAASYDPATQEWFQVIGLNFTILDQEINTVVVQPTDGLYVMGGTKYGGTAAKRGATGNNSWAGLQGGEGGGTAFDRATPAIHYTSSQLGNFWKYATATEMSPDGIGPGGGLYISPLVCATNTGSVPVMGDASGNLRRFDGTSWDTRPTGGGPIRSIGVSKFGTNRLYTGATNGDIYRTPNSGLAYTKIDAAPLPDRSIGGVAESANTADFIIAGLQGTGFADVVYRCLNASSATPVWTNRSGSGLTGLPAVSVNDVERDPFTNVWYAATDVGLFVSPDGGAHWYSMNSMGLPNTPVMDLWHFSSAGSNFLYAATYGRGIWRCFLNQRFLTQIQIAKPAIYGGQQNTVTLKLNGAAPAGCLAILTDSSTSVSIPGSFVIPQGATQSTFTTFSTNPAATETETITGTVYGTTTTGSFIVHHVPNFTYTPESANVYGGNRFNATINMGAPAPLTAVFTFSDNAAEISSPAATSIATGAQTQTVALHTLPVAVTINATISAILANKTKTSAVGLQPRPELAALTVAPPSVTGGATATATIHMSFVGLGGVQTVTTSDTSSAVGSPATVDVPNGVMTKDYVVSTNPVGVAINVTLKARLRTVTKTCTLTVTH